MSTHIINFPGADIHTTTLTAVSNVSVGESLNVTSNLTVSGNATVSGNVGIGTTEPTESLDIVGNLNLQKVSNTASIKLNSNVVTEYTRSKKLIKYPRVAMTANSSGGYVASASSVYSGGVSAAWRAFDGVNDADADSIHSWDSIANSYTSATPGVGQTSSFDGKTGEYINLKLPNKIRVISYQHWTRMDRDHEGPHKGFLYGSNDGFSTYTLLHQFDNINLPDVSMGVTYTHEVNSVEYYDEYRLLVTETQASTYLNISELAFYGIPEYDPDAHGTDVVVRSVPNVPNTDWLEVYYDGRDFSGTPTSITDKSGNNITAAANNITIDTTYQSFEFTQSPKSNIIADNVSFVSGDKPHSIALWFRLKNTNQHNLLFDYRVAGGSSTTGTATGLYILNYNTRLQWYHQGTDKLLDFHFLENTWYHLIGTYAGGGGFSGSTIYINGVDVGGSLSGTNTVLNLPATGTITIGDFLYGSIGMGDGSIANFRLFNRALTTDEVWQLYAYQKEYFGHGNLGMTLKGGRLGIGTSEPRAQLDVRGSARFEGGVDVSGILTSYTKPYTAAYPVSTLSPDVWAVAGESTSRVGGGGISYTSGVSIKYLNGVPMWFFGGRDESVDILNTISSTTNTWTVALAIAKKPESDGILFTQLNSATTNQTNHLVYQSNGYIGGDEYGPSGGGWTVTSEGRIMIPGESVILVKKSGTGTNQVELFVNGSRMGTSTSSETYNGTTSTFIRLGQRGRYSGYVEQTPLHIGIAAVAVWDSAISDANIQKYITYQSLTDPQ
jgi:hypothetical protein